MTDTLTEPTITMTMRLTRGRRIFLTGDIAVHQVHADTMAGGRGLIWVEEPGLPPVVISAGQFRSLYPDHERRSEDR
jgi:hypothetical protein